MSTDSEHAQKIAKIEKLAYDEAHEGLGYRPCSCKPHFLDTSRPTTAQLRSRAVYYVKFPDEHTQAEHARRARMAFLDADPNYEPPDQWYVSPDLNPSPRASHLPSIDEADRIRKLKQIDRLVRGEEREGLGRFKCLCRTSFEDKTPPTTEQLRSRAVFYVKFADEHTMAEHSRRAHMALLAADPNYEPPPDWCGGKLLELAIVHRKARRDEKLAAIERLVEAIIQDDIVYDDNNQPIASVATVVQADGKTIASKAREDWVRQLDEDPDWEPPRRWCTREYAAFLELGDNPPSSVSN